MTAIDLDELIQRNVVRGSEIVCSGPIDDEKIRRAEAMLGLFFPPSYKQYLSRYGAMEIDGRSFSGLTQRDGDAFLCIDTSQKDTSNESPLVLISPDDGRQRGGVVANDLIDYLVRNLSA